MCVGIVLSSILVIFFGYFICFGETTHRSISRIKINLRKYTHIIEYSPAIKKNEPLTHKTAQLKSKIMLSGRSQIQNLSTTEVEKWLLLEVAEHLTKKDIRECSTLMKVFYILLWLHKHIQLSKLQLKTTYLQIIVQVNI